MENKIFGVIVLFTLCTTIFAFEVEDLNGTWVSNEEALNSSRFVYDNYSWGKGRTIPNFSIDYDIGKKRIFFAGNGSYLIDSMNKDDNGTINLTIISIENRERIREMKVTFIDYQRAYITCNVPWTERTLSEENPWIWYRFSGPERDEIISDDEHQFIDEDIIIVTHEEEITEIDDSYEDVNIVITQPTVFSSNTDTKENINALNKIIQHIKSNLNLYLIIGGVIIIVIGFVMIRRKKKR